MYSALKVNGKKLYELAREGVTIERKPRRIIIEGIDIINIDLPLVTMKIGCSKGTYIRSLCRDIGEKLGCGAAMESLVRSRVGVFNIEDAIKLDEVEKLVDEGKIEDYIKSVDLMFSDIPKVVINEELNKKADNGNSFYKNELNVNYEEIGVYKQDGTFIGIYKYVKGERLYKPVKLFFTR
jgi:tRNA pseudouridine55 synthase